MNATATQPLPIGTATVLGPDGAVLNKQQIAAKLVLHRLLVLVADGYPTYRPSYADVQFLTACIYGISTRHQLSPAQMKCLEILEKKAAAKIKVCRDQRETTIENNAASAEPPPAPVPVSTVPQDEGTKEVPSIPKNRFSSKQVVIPVAKVAPIPASKSGFIDDEEAELDRLESELDGDIEDDSLPDVEVD